MRPIRSWHLLAALVVPLTWGTGPALAQVCAGTDAEPALCPAGTGDCVVSTDCSLPSGLFFDLGSRRLIIAENKTLTIEEPGQLGVVADGIELLNAAKISAAGAGTSAVQLVSTSSAIGISMATNSRIVSSSRGDGGTVVLDSEGPVVMNGALRAVGANFPDSGGYVSIVARGNVSISGTDITVNGGADGFGGDIDITATDGASVIVQSILKLEGGDGGTLSIDAEGNVDIANTQIDVDAILAGGYGGEIDVSGLDVRVAATVEGRGKQEEDDPDPVYSGGDGAAVSVTSLADMVVDGTFDLGGALSGIGGDFELEADGNLTVLGKVLARADGKYGGGSEYISLSALGDVTVGAKIDAVGGWSGGSIDIMSLADGGMVRITETGELQVDALGLPADGQTGGTVLLDGCVVDVRPGAVLSAKGPTGSNVVQARTSMVIAGELQAGNENRFEYRDDQGIINIVSPPNKIVPEATQVHNPLLSCCGAGCFVPTTTTSLPPTTTTTTTSLPPTTTTTTTSLPPTTTTTTTSLPPTTTTTTTVGPTTTMVVTTSTTVESSTTTTAPTSTTASPSVPTTTTQPPAPSCSAEPTAYDAATCGITLLTDQVERATPDELGGRATARQLRAFLRRADRFLSSAQTGKSVGANLRRALRQVKQFERAVQKGVKRRRRQIDREVADVILSLSTDTRTEIGELQANGL